MGNTCCIDQTNNNQIQISQKPQKSDYQQSQWPKKDEFILKHIKELKIQKELPFKHRQKDLYYVGQWVNLMPEGEGLIYSPNNLLYIGNFNEGAPKGKGKCIYVNSQVQYEGNFVLGLANGKGTLTNKRQKYSFNGQWVNSKPNRGVLKFENSRTVIELIDYSQKKSTIQYQDGSTYNGSIDIKSFLPDGYGTVKFPDQSTYNGEWQIGKMHGKGTFKWKNKRNSEQNAEIYEGQYQFGRKHGVGKFTFKSGNIYEGSWVQGKMTGKGTLYDNSGNQLLKGIWEKGQFKQSLNFEKQATNTLFQMRQSYIKNQ